MKGYPVSRGAPPRAGVCILRVERQSKERMLITVTTTLDVNLSSLRHTQSVTGPGDALALVAEFLREYERSEISEQNPDCLKNSGHGDD
jgi:hypothetical protein